MAVGGIDVAVGVGAAVGAAGTLGTNGLTGTEDGVADLGGAASGGGADAQNGGGSTSSSSPLPSRSSIVPTIRQRCRRGDATTRHIRPHMRDVNSVGCFRDIDIEFEGTRRSMGCSGQP